MHIWVQAVCGQLYKGTCVCYVRVYMRVLVCMGVRIVRMGRYISVYGQPLLSAGIRHAMYDDARRRPLRASLAPFLPSPLAPFPPPFSLSLFFSLPLTDTARVEQPLPCRALIPTPRLTDAGAGLQVCPWCVPNDGWLVCKQGGHRGAARRPLASPEKESNGDPSVARGGPSPSSAAARGDPVDARSGWGDARVARPTPVRRPSLFYSPWGMRPKEEETELC